jgi:hypothetical protein
MVRVVVLGIVLAAFAGAAAPPSLKPLMFLTRPGCKNTAVMAERLDAVLVTLGWPKNYTVVDISTLPASDPRTGYPTPTLLWSGNDIFGMSEPTPPYPEPT